MRPVMSSFGIKSHCAQARLSSQSTCLNAQPSIMASASRPAEVTINLLALMSSLRTLNYANNKLTTVALVHTSRMALPKEHCRQHAHGHVL